MLHSGEVRDTLLPAAAYRDASAEKNPTWIQGGRQRKPEERVVLLEGFLREFSGAPQAAEARALLERLKSQAPR